MRIKVIASGSTGNCYVLEGQREKLLIECGIRYETILQGIDYEPDTVAGCLVSHEHQDHSKSMQSLAKEGITVYSGAGTLEAMNLKSSHRLVAVQAHQKVKIGEFTVLPFDVKHDANEPLGFLIQHQDMGKLLFLTDLSYCPYKFLQVDHIMVECNYEQGILEENIRNAKVKEFLKNRILRSHFELGNVKKFLQASDLKHVKNILLLHLSDHNGDEELFKKEIEKVTGKPVYIARRGLAIPARKDIF